MLSAPPVIQAPVTCTAALFLAFYPESLAHAQRHHSRGANYARWEAISGWQHGQQEEALKQTPCCRSNAPYKTTGQAKRKLDLGLGASSIIRVRMGWCHGSGSVVYPPGSHAAPCALFL